MKLKALPLILLTGLAACGGGNDSSPSTVSQHDGQLVDSDGSALYTSTQEKNGTVSCTGACTRIWLPLAAKGEPTAGSDVSGKLGVVKRPDGSRQVTLDGRPLYRFAQDGGSGKATGDGVTDSFAGTQFTWHAEGTAPSSSGGGSYGY